MRRVAWTGDRPSPIVSRWPSGNCSSSRPLSIRLRARRTICSYRLPLRGIVSVLSIVFIFSVYAPLQFFVAGFAMERNALAPKPERLPMDQPDHFQGYQGDAKEI